ncbi:denticleless protein homolog [Oncorhynchus masou masou]|uniref:denticleless protein homolog n=1 Tax=Oncorhynchus masou masou TaxID=90313 RepID=UPI0031831211
MLFRSIVERGVRKRRRNDLSPKYPLSSLLNGYQCARHDEHISYGKMGVAVPPFGCAFSTARGLQSVFAVANEEGVLRLYNTDNRQSPVLKEWMVHENAVFDLAWVPGEASLVTASGDQMAKLWDVASGELLGSFKGHQCSLKSVAFTQQEKAVFCTGGRDGNIMVWDTRCSKKDGFYRQVKQISGAHNKMDRNTPSNTKKRRPGTRGMAPSVDSQQSVTVVLFRDAHTLISSGAVDGIIKMWDLRKSYTAYHHDPIPLQVYPYPGSSTRKLGYSGLVLDSTGSNLFSNCIDDNIYMFNVSGLKTTPVAVFAGHLNSSFYVKSTVSPDDQFLASGSSDHHTYIWKISDPKQAPMMLQGHNQEVTSIAWCPTDFTKIASCSDDNTVRIWRLDRGTDGAKSSVGEANLVGWACPKPATTVSIPRPLNHMESTPAKSPQAGSLGALSSPQPAACSSSRADVPLPSSTTTASTLQGAKATLLCQKTPSSIRNWFSRTPGSPWGQVTSPLHTVLSPQSPTGTPPSERRAKRRLETGDCGAAGGCDGAEECNCITELYPAAKSSRGLAGMCCPSQEPPQAGTERSEAWEGADLQVEDPSTQADKENHSPGGADWLSVMSQRLRKGVGNTSSIPRSPIACKRRDGRMPTSLAMRSPSQAMRSPRSMQKISSYFQQKTLE